MRKPAAVRRPIVQLFTGLALLGSTSAYAIAPPDFELIIEPMPNSAHIGVPPALTFDPIFGNTDGTAALFRRFSYADSFGNSTFGAGYSLSGELKGTTAEAGGTTGDVLQAKGNLRGTARLFESSRDIVDVRGEARTEANVGYDASFDVLVLGASIFHRETAGALTETRDFSRTFFSASAVYALGPIPITVNGSVVGAVGYTVSGGPNVGSGLGGVEMHFTPNLNAQVVASAAIGVPGARAGVEGQLTLVRASLPVNAEASIANRLVLERGGARVPHDFIDYSLNSTLTVSTLSGEISLFAELLRRRWERTIAQWSGYTQTVPLVNRSGSVQL
jgi:hypothetical protein